MQTYQKAAPGGVSGLQNIIEDLTPELGGDLSIGSKKITTSQNVNLETTYTYPQLFLKSNSPTFTENWLRIALGKGIMWLDSHFYKAGDSTLPKVILRPGTGEEVLVATAAKGVKFRHHTIEVTTSVYEPVLDQVTDNNIGGEVVMCNNPTGINVVLYTSDKKEGWHQTYIQTGDGAVSFTGQVFGDVLYPASKVPTIAEKYGSATAIFRNNKFYIIGNLMNA